MSFHRDYAPGLMKIINKEEKYLNLNIEDDVIKKTSASEIFSLFLSA